MNPSDFYNDVKYCEHCEDYVPYLQSMDQSYCITCGNAVRLFSDQDWDEFHTALKERRPKGGRPRKNKGDSDKESA